ncbi:MAG: hypothetical protein HY392_00265 [Candidatus Diapherotrites archaeon]|nr:hypothetical protein [Candidatus Diapherotrites archaeon]
MVDRACNGLKKETMGMNAKKTILTALAVVLLAQLALAQISVTKFEIAGGAGYTSDNRPDLLIETSPQATEMQFSCNNANYTSFIPFASPYSEFSITDPGYGCTTGDGQKTVYVIVKAGDGSVSTPVSDSIVLDQTAPEISIISPQDGSTTSSRTVSFDARDTVSGIRLDTLKVDVNAIGSTSFSTGACTAIENGYHCEYEETKFTRNNTDYRVKVWAGNNAGLTSQETVTFHYIDSGSPLEVTGLSATPANQRVVLLWNQNTAHDLDAYRIYISTSSGFETNPETLLATVSKFKTSFSQRALSNGTTYYFKVTAVDRSGNEGPDSAEVSATPSKNAAGLEAPEISSPTHTDEEWNTDNNPKFLWSLIGGAAKYRCSFRKTGEGDSFTDCSRPPEASPFDPSGTQEGTWIFKAKACDSVNNCGPAGEFTARIDTQNPEQVSGIQASANQAGKTMLEWSDADDLPAMDNSGIKEYLVYRSNQSGFGATEDKKIGTAGGGGTSFIDPSKGLEEGTRYYYKVRAVDNAGNMGVPSAEKSIVFEGLACTNDFTFGLDDYVGAEFEAVVESEKEMKNPKISLKLLGGSEIEPLRVDEEKRRVSAVFRVPQDAHGKTAEITITSQDPDGGECSASETTKIDTREPEVDFTGLVEGQKVSKETTLKLNVSDLGSQVDQVKVFYRQGTGEFQLLGTAQKISASQYELRNGLSSIPAGYTELKVQAFDFAGNVAEKTVSVEVTDKTSVPAPDGGVLGLVLLGAIVIVFIAVVAIGLALLFKRQGENKKWEQPPAQQGQKNDSAKE